MKSLILSSAVLVFAFVHSTINDEDREGLSSIKYTWTFRGILVNKICSKRSFVAVSGYGDLLIENFDKQDHGAYTCEVELVTKSGVRVVENIQKDVNESYVISEIECSSHSCVNTEKCYYSSSPNRCRGKGDICCKNNL